MKTYPLVDSPSKELCEKHNVTYPQLPNRTKGRVLKAVNSRQFRCPKKGEYYLSGAIPEAYKAPNDLSMEFYIANFVVVEVERKVIETIVD